MHTPGPWTACQGDARRHYNIECKGAHNDLLPVATLRGTDREDNARLIAAAPDLLAALQGFSSWLELAPENYQKHFADRLIVARAAMAKATGKTTETTTPAVRS